LKFVKTGRQTTLPTAQSTTNELNAAEALTEAAALAADVIFFKPYIGAL
jgi:hypothetical protein